MAGKTLTRRAPLERSRGPIDKRARARRRAGGQLAVGRNSGTRASLTTEREYVKARSRGRCELCWVRRTLTAGTDFAHCPPKSQPGSGDDRYHALWTCNGCNLAMQGLFSHGRPLVTPVTVNGVRGFDVEWVQAASKFAYQRGDYTTLAAGFIAAERTA